MKSRITFLAVALLAVIGGVAVAGNTTLLSPPIGDLIFPFTVPSQTGQNGTIGDTARGGMAPVNGNLAYTKTVPASLFSLTFGNWQKNMLLEPSGTLAAGYVTMAPAPIDGGEACVFSTKAITLFYVNANTGQSINDAVTTLGANATACYQYSVGNKTWDRSR